MNDIYEPLFLERAAAAIGEARAAAAVKHRHGKGAIREFLIRDLFRSLLPSSMGVATGQLSPTKTKLLLTGCHDLPSRNTAADPFRRVGWNISDGASARNRRS